MKLSQEKGEKFHSFHVATSGYESRSQRLSLTVVKFRLSLRKTFTSGIITADFSSVLRLCHCACALQDLYRVTFKNREGKGDRWDPQQGGRNSSSSEVQFKCSGLLSGCVVCGVWCAV
jgi:hypothetical protein